MENEIKIFKSERFGEIRTAGTSEEPLFCLADVCRAIGIKDVPRCASRLEDDMRQTHPIIDSLGRTQQATFVTESGLYDVIIRSDSESAKPFRKWVTSEVLPSIRKTGGYIAAKAEESVCQNKYGTIPNYSNYIFDRDGNVYSLNYNKTGKTKILKQQKNKYGYMMIQLFDDNRKSRLLSVHRLIAMAFLPLVEGKNYVNHIDGVKSNNRVDNLEWCTSAENNRHSYIHNPDRGRGGTKFGKNPNSRSVLQLKDGVIIRKYDSMSRVQEYGFNPGSVSKSVRSGKPYNGYEWRYSQKDDEAKALETLNI